MTLSASSLLRARLCSASAALPQVQRATRGTSLGHAVHGFLEALNRGTPRAEALAALPEEARALCVGIEPAEVPVGLPEQAYAYDVRTGAARLLAGTSARDYRSLGPQEIAGTADLVCPAAPGEPWTVVDWSTDHDLDVTAKVAQVDVYILAVARAHGLASVHGAIACVRLAGPLAWHRWTRDALDLADLATGVRETWDRVQRARAARAEHEAAHVAPWSPGVTVGAHCRDCRAFLACPATTASVRGAGEDAPLGAAYERARTVERWADAVRDRARLAVESEGALPLPDGRRLIQTTDSRGRKSLRAVR